MRKLRKPMFSIAAFAAAALLQTSPAPAGSPGNHTTGYGGQHHPYDHGRESGGKHYDHGRDKHYDHGHDKHYDHGHRGYSRDYGHHHGPGCGHDYYRPRAYYYPRYAPPPYYYPPAPYPPPYYQPPYAYNPVGYYCGHCHYRAATIEVFHDHIVHEHSGLVWEEVLGGLTWYPQPALYVFGELDL